MTFHSTLFPGDLLISRLVYGWQADPYLIVAPNNATIIRVSMVGGGARFAGAAFARVTAACAAAEQFSLDIGNRAINSAATAEDTTLTRVTGSVLIGRAKGAGPNSIGQASGCVGDVKRSGALGSSPATGGASGGDDADTYPLGYGGLGSFDGGQNGNDGRAPYPGAGGSYEWNYSTGMGGAPLINTIPAAPGRATVEFFITDPGYGA